MESEARWSSARGDESQCAKTGTDSGQAAVHTSTHSRISFAIMGARTHRRVPPPRCGVAGCPTLPPRMNSNSARPISPTRPVRHRDLWALVSILHFLPSPHITLSTAPSVGLTHLCSSIRSCSWYRTGRPGTFRSPHSIGSSSARHRNPHYPTCPTPDTRQQCARTHIWLRPETRHTQELAVVQ